MRIDLLEAFGLDPNVIAILKQKYGEQLLPLQERAFKECQILNGGNFLVSAVWPMSRSPGRGKGCSFRPYCSKNDLIARMMR